MHQAHILKFIIPSMHISVFKNFAEKPYRISVLHKDKLALAGIIKQQFPNTIHNLDPLPYRIDPEFKIRDETTASENDEQTTLIQNQRDAIQRIQFLLQKNSINHRIKTLQYQANNPCEDTVICEQLKTIDAYTVSVFDGHGGPELAEYSKSKVNTFIDCFMKDYAQAHRGLKLKNIGQILKEALVWSYKKLQDTFYQIYEQQLKLGNKRIKNVGTCGITAIVHNDKVYVGNSGDSQGIFIVSGGGNLMRSEKANQRLSVNNKSERQRILQQWKDIDSQIIVEQANNCYYLKGRLQPTRSIGDYYLKKEHLFNGEGAYKGPYLRCEPDIKEHQLTKSHKYMVIASDGVWDVLSKNEVMTSMINGRQFDLSKTYYEQEQNDDEEPYLSNILTNILQKSCEVIGKTMQQLKSIQKGKRRNYHDDITIAVINLQNQI